MSCKVHETKRMTDGFHACGAADIFIGTSLWVCFITWLLSVVYVVGGESEYKESVAAVLQELTAYKRLRGTNL